MKKLLSKEEISKVLDILEDEFPDAKAELDHSNPFELLIATILSAQCTDVRVNKMTKDLFAKYKSPEEYLTMTQEDLIEYIKSGGFYNQKSKAILATCQTLVDKFDSKVPDNLEDLMTLPGVGRKTANVVISNAFGVPAIAVDTHVFRVSKRIGLANGEDVDSVEKQLMENIDRSRWTKAHHMIIFQGRRVCKARRPLCEECRLTDYCLYFKGKEEKND